MLGKEKKKNLFVPASRWWKLICWGLTEVGRVSGLFFQSWESVELYCQCDVHLTQVQMNNLLLRSNLSMWIISSLQNCWGFAKSALQPRNRSPADLHFTFINSCLRPRKTLLAFGRLLSVPIVASSLPTRPMFFDTWISLPVLAAAPSWTFGTPISPMPHELPQNLTYSTKLSSTGKRRYRSGNTMRSISICQMMRAPNPFAQKQLQTSNIIQGHQVPMGRVQLLCPISSLISMPTCDMRTSSIHSHLKKIGSLVLGSYGLGWVWRQSIVLSPWSWWAHISIDVLLLIEPSSARLNISHFLFGLPESYISAWRCYPLGPLGNVIQLICQPPPNGLSPFFIRIPSTASNLFSAIRFSNATFHLSLARFGKWPLELCMSTMNGSPGIMHGNFRWVYDVLYTAQCHLLCCRVNFPMEPLY